MCTNQRENYLQQILNLISSVTFFFYCHQSKLISSPIIHIYCQTLFHFFHIAWCSLSLVFCLTDLKFFLGVQQPPHLWLWCFVSDTCQELSLIFSICKFFQSKSAVRVLHGHGGIECYRMTHRLQNWRYQKILQSCSIAYLSFVVCPTFSRIISFTVAGVVFR